MSINVCTRKKVKKKEKLTSMQEVYSMQVNILWIGEIPKIVDPVLVYDRQFPSTKGQTSACVLK